MVPTKTDECNFAFHLPGAPGEGVMPCLRRMPDAKTRGDKGAVTSFWLPDPDEIELRAAAAINVRLYALAPNVEVGFGPTIEDAELGTDLVTSRGHGQIAVALTPGHRAEIEGGGYFILRVAMVPPPPVSVWLG